MPESHITQAQVDDELFGHLEQLADADRAIARPVSVNFLQRLAKYTERLRLSQPPSAEELALREKVIAWDKAYEAVGACESNGQELRDLASVEFKAEREMYEAARAYARSVEERGQQASSPTAEGVD